MGDLSTGGQRYFLNKNNNNNNNNSNKKNDNENKIPKRVTFRIH